MSSVQVLIVEPSEALANVLSEALEYYEISSVKARSAQEGISVADQKKPKLVIIELLMPRHNGLEFIHEFRSYPDWLDIPIIIYSNLAANDLDLSPQQLKEMGVVEHFYKPTTSLSELIKAAENVFARAHI